MKIINISDDGELTIELTEEEQRLLLEKAINDILREEIERHESISEDS